MHEMDQITSDDWERLARRRVEYADELSAIGYFDRESSYMQASTEVKAPKISDKRFKIDGEARVDYGAHGGYKPSETEATRVSGFMEITISMTTGISFHAGK